MGRDRRAAAVFGIGSCALLELSGPGATSPRVGRRQCGRGAALEVVPRQGGDGDQGAHDAGDGHHGAAGQPTTTRPELPVTCRPLGYSSANSTLQIPVVPRGAPLFIMPNCFRAPAACCRNFDSAVFGVGGGVLAPRAWVIDLGVDYVPIRSRTVNQQSQRSGKTRTYEPAPPANRLTSRLTRLTSRLTGCEHRKVEGVSVY